MNVRKHVLLVALMAIALLSACTANTSQKPEQGVGTPYTAVEQISPEEARQIAEKVVRTMTPPEIHEQISVSNVEKDEKYQLYRFNVSIGEDVYTSYMTLDGKLIFPEGISTENPPVFTAPELEEQSQIPMPPEESGPQPQQSDTVAEVARLQDGWYFFYLRTCSACQEQERILGNLIDKVNRVECSEQKELCRAYNIIVTPTWLKIEGGVEVQRLDGIQSLERLRQAGALP